MAETQTVPVVPALDLTGYRQVLILITDEVEGHVYQRGQKHMVDAVTLAALQAKGMIAEGVIG